MLLIAVDVLAATPETYNEERQRLIYKKIEACLLAIVFQQTMENSLDPRLHEMYM